MSLQSVTFSINKSWTTTKARTWLADHHIKPIKKVHKRGTLLRYRIQEPRFKRYVTKKIPGGINLILGY